MCSRAASIVKAEGELNSHAGRQVAGTYQFTEMRKNGLSRNAGGWIGPNPAILSTPAHAYASHAAASGARILICRARRPRGVCSASYSTRSFG